MTPVFVVIVNYRTGRLAVECLASLESQVDDLRGGRVIVADNHSGDDSLSVLAAAIEDRDWGGWVELLRLPRNGGFAYGNNAGIARARELAPNLHSVVLLNPDTRARAGVIARLIAHLDSHSRAGIAGAAIETDHGERAVSAHVMPSPLGELEGAAELGVLSRLLARYVVSPPPRDAAHVCDWVSGACMAIRREVLDAAGSFDEGFFLYYEEVDLCRRAVPPAGRAGRSPRPPWFTWKARRRVSRMPDVRFPPTGSRRGGVSSSSRTALSACWPPTCFAVWGGAASCFAASSTSAAGATSARNLRRRRATSS